MANKTKQNIRSAIELVVLFFSQKTVIVRIIRSDLEAQSRVKLMGFRVCRIYYYFVISWEVRSLIANVL